jgi:putative two-component system response regulator
MNQEPTTSYKIMVVDDDLSNLRLLERLFRQDYQVVSAASGMEALKLLEQHDVAVIITDQRMPDISGLELLKRTAESRPFMVRIILTGYTDVESLVDSINCGYVYKFLTKPLKNYDLRLTVTRALEHHEAIKSRHELEVTKTRLTEKLNGVMNGFVRAMVAAMEARDRYAHGHARRVSHYSMAIGKRLNLDNNSLEQLSLAAFFHDLGKIGTPDTLLSKRGALTENEASLVKLHVERGSRMLASIPGMEEIAAAVLHHHEHYDGSGYPEGLFSELIPLASRIISVANTYDQLTDPRPFSEVYNHEAAIGQLKAGAEKEFDSQVVRAFCSLDLLGSIRQAVSGNGWLPFLSSSTSELPLVNLPIEVLVREIEMAPLLSLAVMHEANEKMAEPTTSIVAACSQLSEMRLRELVSEYQHFSNQLDSSIDLLSEHSLRCAIAARLIAQKTNILDMDSAYTLGLLHDIGEFLLRINFPREMEEVCAQASVDRNKEEVFKFGVDHAQVSVWILERAGLSHQVISAVQTHHDWMIINEPVAILLHFANTIAHVDDPYKVEILGSERLSTLGITRGDLVNIGASIAASLKQESNSQHKGFQSNISMLPEYVPING